MTLLERIKNGVRKIAAENELSKEYRDVFEVECVPAFRTFYNFMIFPAKYIYRGMYNVWHVVPAPTIGNANATRELFKMGMASSCLMNTSLYHKFSRCLNWHI